MASAAGYFARPIFISGEQEKIEELNNEISLKKDELNALNTELKTKNPQVNEQSKTNKVRSIVFDNELGHFELTKKGMKQYKKISTEYYELKSRVDQLDLIGRGEVRSLSLTNQGIYNVSRWSGKLNKLEIKLDELKRNGEL